MKRFLDAQSIPLLGKIPFEESVMKAMVAGKSVPEYDPDSEFTRVVKSAAEILF